MSTKKQTARVETISLKPSEFKLALYHCAQRLQPVFTWGPPGIGKSSIAKQVAKELGFDHFKDVRLSQMDPTDLRGIPYPAKDGNGDNIMEWAPPIIFNKNKDQKAFYLFDEMNSAPQANQAASYQLILDRAIGEFQLGAHDFVMAAGNRETDKGATFKMPTPLMNRFVHIELRVDFDDWQTYALGEMYDQNVVGYLTFQKQELFEFDPSSASRGFPTPRSWEFVSKLVRDNPNIPEQVLVALIAGSVGEGVAVKFIEYRKNAASLPNPTDILQGKVKELKSREVSLCYALTTSLCYELKTAYEEAVRQGKPQHMKEWFKMCDHFLSFMMKNFQPELVILGARTALAIFRLPMDPSEMQSWEEFAERYQNLILRA